MNLLTDRWIPVRPLDGAEPNKIFLRDLLCGEVNWELSLPRDDMELAALQLLICITQTVFMPINAGELREHIANPLKQDEYDKAIVPFNDWFQLDHPKWPFMQVRGVKANKVTSMDKLMAGLTGATSCCFVNEPNMAATLCGGCVAIALFNQATCTPGFGGGFKEPLRGGTPITTLVQGNHLRQTIWLNVLSDDAISRIMPWHHDTKYQLPTWLEPIRPGTTKVQNIGVVRGLFWQPAHVELLPPADLSTSCSCCGCHTSHMYTGFSVAKFSDYAIEGTWPHPHSPRTLKLNKEGSTDSWYRSFNATAPAWTQLNRFVAKLSPQGKTEGYDSAAVVRQSQELYGMNAKKLHLLVGGYVRSKASIIDRRHEVFTLNHGWDQHADVIKELVLLGIGYEKALSGALFLFCKGLRDKKTNQMKVKGLGAKIDLPKMAQMQFYRHSEPIIEDSLARIDFENPTFQLRKMREDLKRICRETFQESVRSYLNHPEMVHTLAVARLTLRKHLSDLESQQDKGGKNGTTETT
jgi:CRISPR system Cascade subunit CasA